MSKLEIGKIKILKRDISSLSHTIKKGSSVEIIEIGDRGYGVKDINNLQINNIYECGWDIFEQ